MKTYKHKLNMLEPGLKMVKAIGVFALISLICYLLKAVLISYLFGGLTLLLIVILWILIIIEQHQDNVMNRQAIEEEKSKGNY
jgi:phage-related holin